MASYDTIEGSRTPRQEILLVSSNECSSHANCSASDGDTVPRTDGDESTAIYLLHCRAKITLSRIRQKIKAKHSSMMPSDFDLPRHNHGRKGSLLWTKEGYEHLDIVSPATPVLAYQHVAKVFCRFSGQQHRIIDASSASRQRCSAFVKHPMAPPPSPTPPNPHSLLARR